MSRHMSFFEKRHMSRHMSFSKKFAVVRVGLRPQPQPHGRGGASPRPTHTLRAGRSPSHPRPTPHPHTPTPCRRRHDDNTTTTWRQHGDKNFRLGGAQPRPPRPSIDLSQVRRGYAQPRRPNRRRPNRRRPKPTSPKPTSYDFENVLAFRKRPGKCSVPVWYEQYMSF